MFTHRGTRTICTDRLILRQLTTHDTHAAFINWMSDDEVTRYLTWPTHQSEEISAKIIASWEEGYARDDFYQWGIEFEGEVIGTISVVEQSDSAEWMEIGYCIGKNWWHRGIMTEALGAVIHYLFSEVGAQRISARHDPRNPHSGAVMRKCGMRFEGTLRGSDRNNQGICDASVYAILRSDWETPRHFMDGVTAGGETELVQEIYRRFDESSRLTKSRAARVEFITTVEYIEKYLTPGAKILDIGAGAGEYSLYFARKGFEVSALELADANIAAFRSKMTEGDRIDLVQGNALDLSRYESESFDIVLLFGPLYHLHEEADRLRCIGEAKRVCKKGGKIFFAFISNDIVVLTMQQCQQDYLLCGDYNKETFRLDDFPFVFHTVGKARDLLEKAGIDVKHAVAADGASELLQEMINGLDEASYEQYLRYHRYICEKPEFLGMSNHLLFVGTCRE